MLLALHYVYPLTLNKWYKLIQKIEHIGNFTSTPINEISQIFNIPTSKASILKERYIHVLQTPLHHYYEQLGIEAIPYYDTRYPILLQQINDPPTVLYAKGNTLFLQQRKIAIIGSRKATNYSKKVLSYIVPPLVENNYTIVSGLAAGADSFAHEAAIQYGGQTIAVIGHGLLHCYPKQNKKLMEQMIEEQLVVTEYPPYIGPQKWHFPMRNRIISGMSTALVVTEAATRSGTLITTDHALEHGKDVFAVPGPVDSEQSKGTNQLIKDGAIVAWDGYQIINELRTIST